jgi:hypothetical protein
MKDGQGFARKVTLANLDKLAPLLKQAVRFGKPTDAQEKQQEDSQPRDPALVEAEGLFRGIHIQLPRIFKPAAKPKVIKEKSQGGLAADTEGGEETVVVPQMITTRGDLLWKKKALPASDVQRQPGNPTGGVRLTQAGWEVKGKRIDQTTYFKDEVFGKQEWHLVAYRQAQPQSDTHVLFSVEILGHDYGIHTLRVSHKPSGEAGQGNYTTMLHWGELAETIHNLDLVARTFRLYAPPRGQSQPFFIEIA